MGKNDILDCNMTVGRAMTRAFLVSFAATAGTLAGFALIGHIALKALEKEEE